MAYVSSIAMALASQTPSLAIPNARAAADYSGTANFEKAASALLTPPTSVSPELDARPRHDLEMEVEAGQSIEHSGGTPLSRSALSDLDGAATITPSMLARDHLPAIMLGNGPRPIRHVMGELTQIVPGFSSIPPAKARRIVVAALENRAGGGPDGSVAFCKTGWGRWDAHIKGSLRDSGIDSFQEGHLSPPRSEHGSYAMSHSDSAIHMHAAQLPVKYRDQYSGGSWTASSIREEEEDDFNMDMDPLEEAADKMSLDGVSSSDSSDLDEETDDEDWAAVGVDVLRKASLPTPNMTPRPSYRAVSIPYNGDKSWTRRPSAVRGPLHSSSVPVHFSSVIPTGQTPDEQAAVSALMSMGSM